MHNYSINNDYKLRIFFMLSALSLLTIAIAKEWIMSFGSQAIYFSVPSAFTVYGIFYLFFTKYIWKCSFLHTLGLVKTPIVEGEWIGKLRSSVDEFKIGHDIKINIHQTWDQISICLDGNTAESESKMANFRVINPSFCDFEWGFVSTNKPEFSNESYICNGVAKVRLSLIKKNEISDSITGVYYTDKGTHTFGSITLQRVGECLVNT